MKRLCLSLAFVLTLLAAADSGSALAGEIGYVEDFALAADRADALKQLIPGTDEYYYYHCLHYMNLGQWDTVEEYFKLWDARRNGWPQLMREIENRRRLLRYQQDPNGTMQYLRGQLHLTFNHQREQLNKDVNLPTSLDQGLISRSRLEQIARQRHSDLGGFTDSALVWLAGEKLDTNELRHLLKRLNYPDLPNLPQLVKQELDSKHSRGFGAFPIHRKMTRAQLDELLKMQRGLIDNSNFVYTYCSKLQPSDDVNLDTSPEAMRAYLDRLWSFLSKLNPSFNSLKAHVLYRRLVFDRSRGVYDKDRFMTYIQLPRRASYIEPLYLRDYLRQKGTDGSHVVNFSQAFQQATMFPPIRQDEPLIRGYLLHFYQDANDWRGYEKYLNDDYLKPIFAEAKILADPSRDQERYASLLSPSAFQALKDRVDIEFAYTNREYFKPGDEISLDVDIKNIEKLIVKVYRINTVNFFRQEGRSLDTTINLDGLVPNREQVLEYDASPLKRHRETFTFDDLGPRGIYVIDFIGNGKASRALIRLGKLHYLSRTSSAGHVLTVLNEANQHVKDARVYLGGHEYTADAAGRITIPFSTNPSRQRIVLASGDFATLDWLVHQAESYQLQAGFYVDREQLLDRRQAKLLLRPVLYCNGEPVSLDLLDDVRLTIASADIDGISASRVIDDLELKTDADIVVDFTVPNRLRQLHFTLTAKVKSITTGEKVDVAASSNFALNAIDTTHHTEAMHLLQIDGDWALDLLGKTGEPLADRPVPLKLKHRDFAEEVDVSLETDTAGRIKLGKLTDITMVTARSPEGVNQQWTLPTDEHTYPANINALAGQRIAVPYMGNAAKPTRADLMLVQVNRGQFVKDCFESLKLEGGFVVLEDLPAADYILRVKPANATIRIRLTVGEMFENYAVSTTRALQLRNPLPLQITAVDTGDEDVTVQLANASVSTRVHVLVTRFRPAYDAYGHLASVPMPEPEIAGLAPANSGYVSGRDLGDEYRYILDRKYAQKFPGNMLRRPSLLLNPWALRDTETWRQEAAKGGEFRKSGEGKQAARGAAAGEGGGVGANQSFPDLNFLAEQSVVLANLTPDDTGRIVIARNKLGPHQQIRVVAVDLWNTASRDVSLPEPEAEYLDLRLAKALDANKRFAQTKVVSVLPGGKSFTVPDATSSRIEVYDSLAKVYSLYRTLNGDAKLAEFAFILRWPELKDAEKRELYSQYACHELNFFLYHKDKPFFEQVILPYLANKKDKTFMDHFLLGSDLAEYRQPWAHERLNVAERVLLARRIQAEAPATARHVRELWELIPPNPAEFARLFETALRGQALVSSTSGPVVSLRGSAVGKGFDYEVSRRPAGQALRLPSSSTTEDTAAAPPAAAEPQPSIAPAPQAEVAARANGLKLKKDAKESLAMRTYAADSDDEVRRREVRRMYRKVETTKEWVENNYYKLPIEQQVAALVPVSGFWKDYAQYTAGEGGDGFLSENLAQCHRNFTEMMLALAVLDLPFKPAEHETTFDKPQLTITPGGAVVAFHEQITEVQPAAEARTGGAGGILVSENVFRHGDRYIHIDNERRDKYVTDEFIRGVVYGSHVVVTNPTSTPRRLSVLLQVPAGAIPVAGGRYTRSVDIQLDPYHTQQLEHYFYFPASGDFAHYPATVAREDAYVGSAEPFTFHVVDEPSKIDTASWDYISQHGTPREVLQYLQANNLQRTQLDRIAWRMKDEGFFSSVIALLSNLHAYDDTLWSYGIYHNAPAVARQYLKHRDGFVRQCGLDLDSPLLSIEPVQRHWYQHKEYWPLINARAHQLGRRREITNDALLQQYHAFLRRMTYHAELSDTDRLAASYYLLLQDRIGEGLAFFDSVDREKVASRLQYDYAAVYAAFYRADLDAAREIASRHAEHPVDRWRERFATALAQLDEIAGGEAKVAEKDSRQQEQTKLAATEPNFDFKVESRQVTLNYQNLDAVTVNYYLMDIELLFSTNPFVEGQTGQFAWIQPNESQQIDLGEQAATGTKTFNLPETFHNANVLVEVVAAGKRTSQPYYANSLNVQLAENYGQLQVLHADSRKPLAKVYVKVYARKTGGEVVFYKDGYTDLRGRFDYATLSVDELDSIDRFAILILSPDNGAVVRTAAPPKR